MCVCKYTRYESNSASSGWFWEKNGIIGQRQISLSTKACRASLISIPEYLLSYLASVYAVTPTRYGDPLTSHSPPLECHSEYLHFLVYPLRLLQMVFITLARPHFYSGRLYSDPFGMISIEEGASIFHTRLSSE